jgi:hypothetical protein
MFFNARNTLIRRNIEKDDGNYEITLCSMLYSYVHEEYDFMRSPFVLCGIVTYMKSLIFSLYHYIQLSIPSIFLSSR